MTKNTDYSVNKRIEDILEARNIKTKDFAKMAGINPNTFRGYIDSCHTIPLYNLQKIAKTLGVLTSDLLGENENLSERKQLQKLLTDLMNIILEMSKILGSK